MSVVEPSLKLLKGIWFWIENQAQIGFYLSLELPVCLHTLSTSSTHVFSGLATFQRIWNTLKWYFSSETIFPKAFPATRNTVDRNSEPWIWALWSNFKKFKLVSETKFCVLVFFAIKLGYESFSKNWMQCSGTILTHPNRPSDYFVTEFLWIPGGTLLTTEISSSEIVIIVFKNHSCHFYSRCPSETMQEHSWSHRIS